MDDRPHNRNQQGVFRLSHLELSANQLAADEIQSHLVLLRGGAPFLSPSDAYLLDSWLTDGVAVSSILYAIERACEARRKRRSRIPLTLKQAKRHLKKSHEKIVKSSTIAPISHNEHPLANLALKLRSSCSTSKGSSDVNALADDLLSLKENDLDLLSRGASQLFRAFLERQWDQLPSDELEREKISAREELEGIAPHLDESSLATMIEEVVRDRLRQQYPLLCTSAVLDSLNANTSTSATRT